MIGALMVAALVAVPPVHAAPPDGVVFGRAPAGESSGYVVMLEEPPGAQSAGQAQAFVADAAQKLAQRYGGEVGEQFSTALRGFALDGIGDAQARQLAAAPGVARVERNVLLRKTGSQDAPPWGLDRIDGRAAARDNTFTYPNSAPAVTAYVVDSGIFVSHSDFGDRATYGHNFVDRVANYYPNPANDAGNSNDPGNANDCDGHGTHVAGTVGGTRYGVAKDVRLVAVRVLDCSGNGYLSEVVAGIDWVTANAQHPAVVNMSLGSAQINVVLDAALRRSIASGLTWSVAAGNGDADENPLNACDNSPGDVAEAIVVGAATVEDRPVRWSDYGPCVDLYAPGAGITSDWIGTDTATRSLDGTSMAAPHVAGFAALLHSRGVISPQAKEAVIIATALDLPPNGRDNQFGHGLIQPRAALFGSGIRR
jgi:subtilisin family serine protease